MCISVQSRYRLFSKKLISFELSAFSLQLSAEFRSPTEAFCAKPHARPSP